MVISLVQMNMSKFELWGLPGAGKSSVADLLGEHLPGSIAVTLPIKRSLAMEPRETLQQWTLVKAGLFATKWPLPHLDVLRRLEREAIKNRIALARIPNTAILEEGLVHRLWQQVYHNPSLLKCFSWRSLVRFAAPRVIVLSVSPQTAKRRIAAKRTRGVINSELHNAALGDYAWCKARAARDAVLSALHDSQESTIYEVDVDNQSLVDVTRKVVSIVENLTKRDTS